MIDQLDKWAQIGITIGEEGKEFRRDIVRLCYMWKDVDASLIGEMDVMDLVTVVAWFRGKRP